MSAKLENLRLACALWNEATVRELWRRWNYDGDMTDAEWHAATVILADYIFGHGQWRWEVTNIMAIRLIDDAIFDMTASWPEHTGAYYNGAGEEYDEYCEY